MFKIKNTIKFLSVLSVAIPMAALGVSCQKTTRYDQDKHDTLRIITNYGPNTDYRRWNALSSVMKEYNDYLDKNPQLLDQGYMKVEGNFSVGQSYAEVYRNLTLKIRNKDTKTLGNMVLAYPSSAVFLGSYDMLLDLSDIKTDFISHSYIDDIKLLGMDSKKSFILPFGQSSEAMSVNLMLLGYILDTLNKAHQKHFSTQWVEKDNIKLLTQALDVYKKGDVQEQQYLESMWQLNTLDNIDFSKADFKVNDEIITTYDGMFKFSQFIADLLNKEPNNKHQLYVVGIDSPANQIFMEMYNKAGTNFDNYYLKPLKSAKYLNNYHDAVDNPDSPNYESFKETTDQYVNLINTGHFYTQYDSNRDFNAARVQTQHNMIFSISSTSAYRYIGTTDAFTYNGQSISFLSAGKVEAKDGKKTISFWGDTYKFSNTPTDGYYTFDYTRKGNPIFLTEENISQFKDFAGSETEFKVLWNPEYAKRLYLEHKKDMQRIYIKQDKYAKKVVVPTSEEIKTVNKILKEIKKAKTVDDINNIEKQLPKGYSAYTILKNFTQNKPGITTMDPNLGEVLYTTPPLKNSPQDKGNGTFMGQGPSLIGIHANEKQDKAAKLFINWLYSNEHKMYVHEKNKHTGKENILSFSPVEYFAYNSGYLLPTQNFSQQYEVSLKRNKFLDTFISNIRLSAAENGPVPFQDPADLNSDSWRNSVTSAVNTAVRKASYGDKTSQEDFMKMLQNAIHGFEKD